MPDVDATFLPDALFTWSSDVERLRNCFDTSVLYEVVPTPTRAVLRKEYVVISGSSVRMENRDRAGATLLSISRAVRSLGVEVVVAASCTNDMWMLPIAAEAGIATLPARVPLTTALHVLSGASVFVSGRFHPSVLASICGTPCVFMRSNSHKTRSLPALLGSDPSREFEFFDTVDDIAPIVAAIEHNLALEPERRRALDARVAELAQAATGISGMVGRPSARPTTPAPRNI